MILGIDASTTRTGYSLMDGERNLYDYGVIEPDSKDVYGRLKYIYSKLDEYISEKSIDMVVIEDVPISVNKNLKTAKDLCILQGVIISLCMKYGIYFYNYAPTSWRSLLNLYDGTNETKKREIQKQRAVDYVNSSYNLNFKYFKTNTKKNKSDDDMAEAICLGLAYIENVRRLEDEV